MVTTKIGAFIVALFCAIGLLALPNTAAAQATGMITIINQVVPFTSTLGGLVSPITNPCTGIPVDITGLTNVTLMANANATGGITLKLSAVTKGQGVEQGTGFVYSFSENTQATFITSAGVRSDQTLTEKLRLRGAGALDNWDVKELIHVTVNADGSMTSSVDNLTAVCRG